MSLLGSDCGLVFEFLEYESGHRGNSELISWKFQTLLNPTRRNRWSGGFWLLSEELQCGQEGSDEGRKEIGNHDRGKHFVGVSGARGRGARLRVPRRRYPACL